MHRACISQKTTTLPDLKKIELIVAGINSSKAQTNAYALILAEKGGMRRLPIVIGQPEAQAIALQMEKMKPMRPLTHDLFVSLCQNFDIRLLAVNIERVQEGLFISQLLFEKDGRTHGLDSRTSDAVALAIRFGCPIYTNEKVMRTAGITVDETDEEAIRETGQEEGGTDELHKMDDDSLKTELAKAIEEEDYERASLIRDELSKRKP